MDALGGRMNEAKLPVQRARLSFRLSSEFGSFDKELSRDIAGAETSRIKRTVLQWLLLSSKGDGRVQHETGSWSSLPSDAEVLSNLPRRRSESLLCVGEQGVTRSQSSKKTIAQIHTRVPPFVVLLPRMLPLRFLHREGVVRTQYHSFSKTSPSSDSPRSIVPLPFFFLAVVVATEGCPVVHLSAI